jgi:hypothetical protein
MNRIGRSLAVVVTAGVLATPAFAQDTTAIQPGEWRFATTLGLNLAQSSFSSNWAGGDQGSIVWTLLTDATAERQFQTLNWKNVLQLAYGQTAQQRRDPNDPDRLVWDRPDKTTDLIMFESTGRWALGAYVDPYVALRLDSQFRDQSSPLGEISFNPIKLKESAGIARVLRKTADSEAITRLGFGFRQTMAQSFVDPVTLEKDRFVANDGGIEWQTEVTQPLLAKRVLYKSQLLVFQPVFYSGSDDVEAFDVRAAAAFPGHEAVADFWKATDVNWQNTFSAQITKHLGVNLLVQWVYDKFDVAANVDPELPLDVLVAEVDRNVRKAGQFKETLALAFTYALF